MGTVSRTALRLFTLLFFAGNVLLLILIILSGSTKHYPIDRFYWVEGETAGIPNAYNLTRWTFWGACERSNGGTHCSDNLSPAYPISPKDNFHTEVNVPHRFISNRESYYYLSRFSFVFFWIALAFVGISFILYVLSWCSSYILKVVLILSVFGCIFNVIAVVLQTAVSVMARNAFHHDNRSAKVGAPLLGIAWASVVVVLFDTLMMAFYFGKERYLNKYNTGSDSHREGFFHRKKDSLTVPEPIDPYVGTNPTATGGVTADAPVTAPIQPIQPQENQHKGIKFFTIRRNQKNAAPDDESV